MVHGVVRALKVLLNEARHLSADWGQVKSVVQ